MNAIDRRSQVSEIWASREVYQSQANTERLARWRLRYGPEPEAWSVTGDNPPRPITKPKTRSRRPKPVLVALRRAG